MTIRYHSSFVRMYKKLTPDIKNLAKEAEKKFRLDPFARSLKTHKLHGKLSDLWAFSVNNSFRIVFEFAPNDEVFFLYIGDHSIYE